jgi:hypothetical protein
MVNVNRNAIMLSIRRLQRIIKGTRACFGCFVSTIYLVYELVVHVTSKADFLARHLRIKLV